MASQVQFEETGVGVAYEDDPLEELIEIADPPIDEQDYNRLTDSYEVKGLIGRGANRVFLVKDLRNGQEYAAKRLEVDDWDSLRDLETEAEALQRLGNVEGVPHYHDFCQEPDPVYRTPVAHLITEYVPESQNLAQLVRTSALPEQETMKIFDKTWAILQQAHNKGVLHRDVKPSNILVDSEGKVYVTDFGLAKIEGDVTRTRSVIGWIGTQGYQSPEHLDDRQEVIPASDLYGLGVTALGLITGNVAREDPRIQNPLEELRQLRRISPETRERLEYALSNDPETRFKALDNVCSEPVSEPRIEADNVSGKPLKRPWFKWWLFQHLILPAVIGLSSGTFITMTGNYLADQIRESARIQQSHLIQETEKYDTIPLDENGSFAAFADQHLNRSTKRAITCHFNEKKELEGVGQNHFIAGQYLRDFQEKFKKPGSVKYDRPLDQIETIELGRGPFKSYLGERIPGFPPDFHRFNLTLYPQAQAPEELREFCLEMGPQKPETKDGLDNREDFETYVKYQFRGIL